MLGKWVVTTKMEIVEMVGELSPTQPGAQSVCVVSDLHLFCRRSRAARYLDGMHAVIADSNLCVLNGDIFDFRWTTLNTLNETAHAAIEWLEALLDRHPHTQFHYVLGNHDNNRFFLAAIEPFADRTPNLSWRHHYLRLGNTLFLHGDVANWRMTEADLTRHRAGWHDGTKKGTAVNRTYDAAFALRLHKLAHWLAFPRKAVVKRLLYYMEDVGQGPDAGVEAVFFGHTHMVLSGYEYGGVRFYNCGAPMPGLRFTMFRTTVDI